MILEEIEEDLRWDQTFFCSLDALAKIVTYSYLSTLNRIGKEIIKKIEDLDRLTHLFTYPLNL